MEVYLRVTIIFLWVLTFDISVDWSKNAIFFVPNNVSFIALEFVDHV